MSEKENQPEKAEEPPVKTEQEDLEEVSHSTADYANYEAPKKERSPIWRKLIIGLVALVILAALAGGAYWFIKNRKSTPETNQQTETAQNQTSQAEAADEITTKTKHYVSQNFQLEFDYPEDWTATPDSAQEISVLSTDLSLKSPDGKPVIGQVLFRIRSSGQKLPGLDSGNATAVRNSQKIDYTKPTQAQRASTYLSFLRYMGNADGFDAIYITGDNGYTKDQSVPKTDIQKVTPIISMEFYLCPNSGCVEVSAVHGIGIQVWDDPNIAGPLTNMFKSLTIN